jgi:3-dehydrotetronate 4-kinase
MKQSMSDLQQSGSPLLGCIADDFTGATDLAGILVMNDMRTTVMLGNAGDITDGVDAIVIALKSRSAPMKDAIDSSLTALRWLRHQGCRQFFFKYCSTFDSTPHGNIGPVTEALMDELGADFTIACPAFPANHRTIYSGYLFVGNGLLEESAMRFHPINPMTDSNLVRLLQAQSKRRVGLIDYSKVCLGRSSISKAITKARASGIGLAIIDAVSESDLREIASACKNLPLLTGGSGLAAGIPETFRSRGLLHPDRNARSRPHVPGLSAIISGSCSEATQRQVAWVEQLIPSLHLDPLSAPADPHLANKAVEWARSRIDRSPVLISATTDSIAVKQVQAELGIGRAGRLVENLLADIACRLVEHGVRRLIVAGGETSGAVVKALGVRNLRVGPQIDPGVHWAVSESDPRLAFALKSGNFGSDDFFAKAWDLLQ